MVAVTTNLPEALNKKVDEYAITRGLVRPSATGPVPNKAEALRHIINLFFNEGKL